MNNLPNWTESVIGSLKNSLTFGDQLFSSDPATAMVAWTLLATITIPITVFGHSIIDGKRSSKIQRAQLEASKSSAAAAKSAAQQSLVQGLEAKFDYETALKYFNEISEWDESSLKELGLRRLRMQSSVSLPGNGKSIESPRVLTYEAWKDYKDSFEKRFQENSLDFIKQLKNFLSEYGNNILDSEYGDIARLLFEKKINFDSDDDGGEAVKDLFRCVPKLVKKSLDYSLIWPADNSLNNISLMVNSLSSILWRDALSREKYPEIRSGMAQPIADFLNTQDFRNLSDLGSGSDDSMLETAVKIVYLAGESAKIHGGEGEVDHLKMRMIEGISSLFRDINFSNIESLNYMEKNTIKEFWAAGCELLRDDEPDVWCRVFLSIQKIDNKINLL